MSNAEDQDGVSSGSKDSYNSGPSPSKEERNWAVILHLSPLAVFMIPPVGLIAPLVLWLLKRRDSHFLDLEGKEVVNFVVTGLIAAAVCTVLSLVLIGIFLLLALGFAFTAYSIVGAVKISNGEDFRYPYILRLVK